MNSHQRESPAVLATLWEVEIHEGDDVTEQENIEAPLLGKHRRSWRPGKMVRVVAPTAGVH